MTTLPTPNLPNPNLPSLPAPAAPSRRAAALPALGQLIHAELMRLLRSPIFALGTLGFPLFFFAIFGLPAVRQTTSSGANVGQIILVSFATYSLLSIAMISFGTVIATERTGGWLRLLRASPMPTALYLCAKIVAAMLFSALALAVLYAFAHFVGGITLPLGVALLVAGKLLLGMVSLVALGLAIGFGIQPNGAQIVGQFGSVVMAFASGIFVPLEQMPDFVRTIAPFMPSYHLGALGVGTVTGHTAGEAQHWLALAATTALFGALAVWAMKRDESREG